MEQARQELLWQQKNVSTLFHAQGFRSICTAPRTHAVDNLQIRIILRPVIYSHVIPQSNILH